MTDTQLSEQLVPIGTGRHIFVAEAGAGPPLVLLHGGGPGAFGTSNYVRNIDALAQDFRVIVPDMPGYGRSSKGSNHNDPFGYVATGIRKVLDTMGVHRASFVGNSLGGACALRIALDTPDLVDRMVLMGPGGVGISRQLPTAGLRKLLSYYDEQGPTLAKARTFIREYLVYEGDSVPDAVIEARYQSSIDPEVVANPPLRRPKGLAGLRAARRTDFTRDQRLSRLTAPTLVIWGADDKVNRPSGAAALSRRMPRCDALLVANTGHWVQWERAEFFNDVTRAFLSGPTAPAR